MKTTVTNKTRILRQKRVGLSGVAFLLAMFGLGSCNDRYDLDEKLPPNFGSNLMTYLEENRFENYSRLVRELGYEEALRGVSLKTLFAADDDAFERFYASNSWGVRKYEDLTTAQKKMLLYSSMLDNSLQVMSLSSTTGASGVTEGNCMRRQTSASIYDTVPIITVGEMPDNGAAWQYYRERGKNLVCMKDMSAVPMTIFVETFLTNNRITNQDVNFLFNNRLSRQSGDAHINGIEVVEGNIRSANGFIHQMAEVITPLDNMAEILRKNPQTKIYSRLIERFSAPFYAGRDVTDAYNLEYGTSVDSVFMKRYYSERSNQGTRCNTMPDGTVVDATLKFDPGWNAFYSDNPNAISSTVALQENMGVMLVPSDAALEAYWNTGTGRVLKDYYGSWDNIPDRVISKLINNNMLNSWINSVPSKFDGIVNSTQDKMGIKPSDVDSVWLGCNGAIYLTNRVFSPTEYVSVSFPALVNETMNILYWAIDQLEYGSYLNSLDSYYSLFVPTNEAMLSYIDPVSFGKTETEIWRFHYKKEAETEAERVWASVWQYDLASRTVGDSLREVTNLSDLKDRMEDILDNHIVVGNIENGHEFYRTKNGGVLRVKNEGGVITAVQGTLQADEDRWIPVTQIYDESKEGNGKTYIIEAEPLLTTRRSVFDVLDEQEEFSLFYELLHGSNLLETSRNNNTAGSSAGNLAALNNYHYTIYAPTNESLQAIINKGVIHTWEEIDKMEEMNLATSEEIDAMKAELNAFLRYHVQDNSLMIGMDYTLDGGADTFTRSYETAIMNEETQKFYTLEVQVAASGISVTDRMGNVRRVQTDNPALYNRMVREYWIQGQNTLASSSFAVVHRIDGPLFYK